MGAAKLRLNLFHLPYTNFSESLNTLT